MRLAIIIEYDCRQYNFRWFCSIIEDPDGRCMLVAAVVKRCNGAWVSLSLCSLMGSDIYCLLLGLRKLLFADLVYLRLKGMGL